MLEALSIYAPDAFAPTGSPVAASIPGANLAAAAELSRSSRGPHMAVTTKSKAAKTTSRSPRKATVSTSSAPRATRPAKNGTGSRRRAAKWVYLFEEGGSDMRDLLGGKGAGVAEMTRAGLPVPPGFTITTEACNAYYASGKRFPDGMWEQAIEALHHVEEKAGKKLGDVKNPLLVSVRSGAKFSMPGMMDTVLNLGLNATTLE